VDALLAAVGWELQEQHPKQEHSASQSKGASNRNQLLIITLDLFR
jgi:hypothetical protein